MSQAGVIKAIYRNGTLQLLDPVNIPEGAEVLIEVWSKTGASYRRLYSTRPQPPESLMRLASPIKIGGDAVADAEALYDADWN